MPATKPQPIAGVSAGYENIVEILYPSIAASAFGRALGSLYESIPLGTRAVKVSHLFALLLAPVSLLMYLGQKMFGEKYEVTNRAVKRWGAIGVRLRGQVPLTDIADVGIVRQPGQAFYKAADLHLKNAAGQTLLVLEGVPYPERYRQVIVEARDARMQVASSMSTIQARQTA